MIVVLLLPLLVAGVPEPLEFVLVASTLFVFVLKMISFLFFFILFQTKVSFALVSFFSSRKSYRVPTLFMFFYDQLLSLV